MWRSGGIAFLFLGLLITGCGGTSVSQIAGPEPVRCQIGLSSAALTAPSTASQLSVAVSADRECAWTSRSDATWLQATPASGQGEGALTVSVAANPQTVARAANVAVNDAVLRVTQVPAPGPPQPPPTPCTYRLEPTSRAINENGGSRTVRVVTEAHCPWVAATGATWLVLTPPTSGTGTTTITYTVTRNTAEDDRIGVITIAGQTHVVRQDGDD